MACASFSLVSLRGRWKSEKFDCWLFYQCKRFPSESSFIENSWQTLCDWWPGVESTELVSRSFPVQFQLMVMPKRSLCCHWNATHFRHLCPHSSDWFAQKIDFTYFIMPSKVFGRFKTKVLWDLVHVSFPKCLCDIGGPLERNCWGPMRARPSLEPARDLLAL